MFKFWKNDKKGDTVLNSHEYDLLTRRIIDISASQELANNKINIIQSDVDNLRGKFNRRLKGIEQEEDKAKDINTTEPVYFG